MAGMRELLIKYVADTTQFQAKTAAAASSMQKFTAQAKTLGSVLTGGIIGGGAVYGMMRLGRAVHGTMLEMDALAKTSRRLGMSARDYQSLGLAAELSGTSIEKATKMVDILNRRVGEISLGTSESKTYERIFGKLGVDADALNNMTALEQISAISRGLQGLSTVSEKTSVAMGLLGRAGTEGIIMLSEWEETIERAKKATSGLVSDEDLKRIEELNNQYAIAKTRVGNWWKQMVVNEAQAFTDENYMRDWMREMSGMPAIQAPDNTAQVKAIEEQKAALERSAQIEERILEIREKHIDKTQELKDELQAVANLYAESEGKMSMSLFIEETNRLQTELKKQDERWQSAEKYADQYGNKLAKLAEQYREIISLSEYAPDLITPDVQAQALESLAGEAMGQFDVSGGDATERYQSAFSQLNAAAGSLSPELMQAVGASIEQAFGRERTEELQSFADALQQATMTPAEEFAAEMQALNEALNAGAISWDLYARGAEQARDALYQTTEAAQYMRELQSFAQSEFMATRNPFEEYDMHMHKLNDALAAGVLDWDTYNRSMMKASYDMDRALGLDKMYGGGGGYDMPQAPMMPAMPAAPVGAGTAGFATASQIDAVLAGTGTQSTAREQLQETKKIRLLTERYVRESPAGIFL